jgi:hypothetical protein
MTEGVLRPYFDEFMPEGWEFQTFKGNAGAVVDTDPSDDGSKLKVMIVGSVRDAEKEGGGVAVLCSRHVILTPPYTHTHTRAHGCAGTLTRSGCRCGTSGRTAKCTSTRTPSCPPPSSATRSPVSPNRTWGHHTTGSIAR